MLSVNVVSTTPEGTRCALLSAKRLTQGLDARIALLVPRLQSFYRPYDPTGVERAALVDAHRALAADVGVNVTVLFCVCHRLDDVVHEMLDRSSLVIVGGRRRRWWPSREQRLAERATTEGYPVIFAAVDAVEPTPFVALCERVYLLYAMLRPERF